MSPSITRFGSSLFSVILVGDGLAMLIAPDEVGSMLGLGGPALIQLIGAAWIGLGMGLWTARSAPLGGIYGRAVVIALQMNFFVGATVIGRHAVTDGGPPALWALVGVYTLGAIFFGLLLFLPPASSS